MKTKFLQTLCAIVLLLSTDVIAQTTITIPSANTSVAVTSASVRRKPLGTNRSYERTAMKYSQNEIGLLGNITSIAFYCDSVLNPGKAAIKVYIKEVADTTFTASTTSAELLNATLVFADTLQSVVFQKNTWINIPFTTPFLHANPSNIEIIIETNSGGTNGTDLTTVAKGFRFSSKGTSNTMQYWQSNTNSSTIPTGTGTVSNLRPNIQMTISAAAGCVAPPNAGTTLSSSSSICANTNFNLSLQGVSTGLGLSYQWVNSSNGTSWDTIANARTNTLVASQTTSKYYACIVTCNGQKDTSNPVQVLMNSFYDCYCSTGLGGGCNNTTAIDSVSITGTTLAKGSTGCSVGSYTKYAATGNTTANLTQGETYALTAKFIGASKSSVWIDYNRNGVFENSEWKQIALTSVTNTPITINLNIPLSAQTGLTGMRIRTRSTNATNDSTSACTNFGNSGETEDYIINIVASSACTSPPVAGTLNATDTLTCVGSNVVLSLTGNTSGTGQTYAWYSSTNGTNWNLISGPVDKIYTATITGEMYYQCRLTCNGFTSNTNTIRIKVKPYFSCYCVSGIGGNCTTQATAIDSIAIAGTSFNNGGTGCGLNAYTSYADTGRTTATLTQGESYILSSKYTGSVKSSLWIDYNHNGVYENSEWQQICTTAVANVAQSTSILIPLNALTGKTGMRIRTRSTQGANDSTSACVTFGSGETEDYLINIIAASPCVQPPNPGTIQSNTRKVCAGGSVTLNLIGNTTGSGQTLQWLSSTDSVNWAPIAGETKPSLTQIINSAVYYACEVNCAGVKSTSPAVKISTNAFYDCYCVQGIGGGCVNTQSSIDTVIISGTTLNNANAGCAPTFYTKYPASGNTTARLIRGDSYEMLTSITGTANASVWIDYDQNGNFDSTEWAQICDTNVVGKVNAIFIGVPPTAKLGLTGMRIRTRSVAGLNTSINACTTFGSGETEDYVILIDTVVVIQGVQYQKNSNNISIYPNPAKEYINLSMKQFTQGSMFIYDTKGVLIKQMKIKENNSKIGTEDFNNGLYTYQFINENKSESFSGKFIIIK